MIGIAVLVTFTWPIGESAPCINIKSDIALMDVIRLIGITTTIDTFLHSPPYLFDTIQASSMRFAGVIGTLCGLSHHSC